MQGQEKDAMDNARIARVEAQVEALKKELHLRMEAHHAIHTEESKADELLAANMTARLETLNESRAQINDQTRTFITRETSDIMRQHLSDRINVLEGMAANLQGRIWAIGVGVTIFTVSVSAVMTLAITLLTR